jgi:integrase
MLKCSTSRPAGKPAKPAPDFPLWVHGASGRWCRKIKGRRHYFGYVKDDPDGAAALEAYRDHLAGRSPQRRDRAGATVRDACNSFYAARKRALAHEIQRVRSVFKHAWENGVIEQLPRSGAAFKKPSAKVLRANRAARVPRLFEPAELRRLIDAADVNLKAMLLLACNGGLGNHDCGTLPLDTARRAVETGWLDYPRGKTGIERRIPLWDETREALRAVIDNRPDPRDEADKGLLFIGKRGRGYISKGRAYEVCHALSRLKDAVGVNGRNATFYSARHNFQTIGEEAGDVAAVRAIMGHAAPSGDLSSIYREPVSDARLHAVVEHVRRWLYGDGEHNNPNDDNKGNAR